MPSQGPTPVVSFGPLQLLLLLIIAPPLILWDNYKMWRWKREQTKGVK